jgi:hypothetical protein
MKMHDEMGGQFFEAVVGYYTKLGCERKNLFDHYCKLEVFTLEKNDDPDDDLLEDPFQDALDCAEELVKDGGFDVTIHCRSFHDDEGSELKDEVEIDVYAMLGLGENYPLIQNLRARIEQIEYDVFWKPEITDAEEKSAREQIAKLEREIAELEQ